jgi:hypothetical protein
LRQEKPGIVVGESTVREYVNLRKRAMGLLGHEVFVPQSYQFGSEAQVDWYEIQAEFEGQPRKTYIKLMMLMERSGSSLSRAPAGKLRRALDTINVFRPPISNWRRVQPLPPSLIGMFQQSFAYTSL